MNHHPIFSHRSRDADSRATDYAILTAVVIIAHQVAGKATRDALFLTHYNITDLPKAVILGAVCSILAVLAMSRLLPRRGPVNIVPLAFALSAALFIAEWYFLNFAPRLVALLLYLHMAMFGAVLISGFWSIFNERFDPHSAKRIVTRIAAAATLGGLAGGLIAERVSAVSDIRTMLLVLGAAHLFSMFTVRGMARSGAPPQSIKPVGETISGLEALRTTPYLQLMALLMVLGAVVAALLDYALKAEASIRFSSSESLIAFFALFYAISGGVAFGLQTALGRRTLKRLGLGSTIAIMPAAVIVAGFIGVSLTTLWTVVVLRGAQTAIANSFFRSGFELLYSPVAREKKRAAKAIIDVGSDRVGDMLGGGLVLLLLLLIPDLPVSLVIGFAILVAVLTLLVIRKLKQGYVTQLADSLRHNHAEVPAHELIHASPWRTRSGYPAFAGLETDWHPASNTASVQIGSPAAGSHPGGGFDSILNTIHDLRSNDIARMRSAITGNRPHPLLVPYVIPLLGYEELAQEAQFYLSSIATGIEGQLADAMLNPGYLNSVHLRLAEVLEQRGTQRALDGLLSGLHADHYEVRHACAQSIYRLTAQKPGLHVSAEPVLGAVEMELQVENDWVVTPPTDDNVLPYCHNDRAEYLEHIFRLLALAQDREVMDSCFQALLSNDRTLHGTALEYLENALPQEIRSQLWFHIRGATPITRSHRDQKELADQLLHSTRQRPALGEPDAGRSGKPHTVISLHGEIDLGVAPLVGKQILEVLAQGKNLVVDFSQVSYIDSSGISSLVEGYQYAQENGLEFALAGVGEIPMRVLRLCNMDKVFTIYKTPPAGE